MTIDSAIDKTDLSIHPIDCIRIVGRRFKFSFGSLDDEDIEQYYDRQVLAFGEGAQRQLKRLHVGIVGVGGTGSSVFEQLVRLGVGQITVCDGDAFDTSNLNRVYGSSQTDAGIPKTNIALRLAEKIGLGTRVQVIDKPCTFNSTIEALKVCDVVFGCTDDQWGRSLLTRLAIYYYIPVFDMGVQIDSDEGIIRSVQGRVTTLIPGEACLFCRGRISSDRIREESDQILDPEKAQERRNEGYAPELEAPAPSVIPFTTAIAASAVSELLHRMTGFKGAERRSSETLHLIDLTRIRTNRRDCDPKCFCANRRNWGRGDTRPMLDSTWRPE